MKRTYAFARTFTLMLLVFALVLLGGLALIARMDAVSSESETELIRSAVRDAVITCYAVEGAYPTDAEYLQTRYGLAYDPERYIVRLENFASNLMPEIHVLEIGQPEWRGGYRP